MPPLASRASSSATLRWGWASSRRQAAPMPERPAPTTRTSTCSAASGWPVSVAGRGSVTGVPLDEAGQDPGGLGDDGAVGHVLEVADLAGREVAVVAVDLDPGAQPVDVELGVELGGVDVRPIRNACTGQVVEPPGSTAPAGSSRTASLWPRKALNLVGSRPRSGSRSTLLGQGDLDAADRLAVGPVDDAAAEPTEHADAVAGAEERRSRRRAPARPAPARSASTRRCMADFASAGSLMLKGPPPRMMPDQSSRSSPEGVRRGGRARGAPGAATARRDRAQRSTAAYSSSAASSSARVPRKRNGFTTARRSGLDGGAARDQGVDVGDAPGGSGRRGCGHRARARAAGRGSAPVREKRGAGAGWSEAVVLDAGCRGRCRWGWSFASEIGSTGATQASVPSKTAHHSAWVRVRKVSAISARSSSYRSSSSWPGAASAMPSRSTKRREELRLERADGHVPAVGGLVEVVERRAAVEQVGRALLPVAAAGEEGRGHGVEVGGAVDDRGVDDLPLAADPGLEQRGEQPDDEVGRAAAEVADEVGREVRARPCPGPGRAGRR